jgi:flagellar FliL protein
MSDIDLDTETAEGEGEPARKKLSGKFLVLYIILPLLAVGGLGYGAYAFFLSGDSASGGAEGEVEVSLIEEGEPVFYDLPEFLVNLSSPSGGPTRYLKLRVSLELANEDGMEHLEMVMPRVVDGFQVYLRELRPEDFQGSAGMFLLRQELLRRVNLAARPVKVTDVLFREVIVQ